MTDREYRRILLDGNVVEVVRHGDDAGRRTTAARSGVDDAAAPAARRALQDHRASTSTTRQRVEELMTTLPAGADLLPQAGLGAQRPRGAVVRPQGCKWLNYEGEIAIVIGRTARNISPDEAGDYIRGYTIGNDYGLHDFRDTDSGSMLRVKGADTLCPLGPGPGRRLGLPRTSRSAPSSTARSSRTATPTR